MALPRRGETGPVPDYRLVNARNRVAALEFERDHPSEFNHAHPILGLGPAIAAARERLARLERESGIPHGNGKYSPRNARESIVDTEVG